MAANLSILSCLNALHPGARAQAHLELRRIVEGIALWHPNASTRKAAADWLRVTLKSRGRSRGRSHRLAPARVSLRPRAVRATRLLSRSRHQE